MGRQDQLRTGRVTPPAGTSTVTSICRFRCRLFRDIALGRRERGSYTQHRAFQGGRRWEEREEVQEQGHGAGAARLVSRFPGLVWGPVALLGYWEALL